MKLFPAEADAVFLLGKEGKGGGLHEKADAVIVFRIHFIQSVLAGEHPVQILAEPVSQTFKDCGSHMGRDGKFSDGKGNVG